MTDEYTARERALTLAHADSRDIILPAEDVIELAEKYLAFLMPAPPKDELLAKAFRYAAQGAPMPNYTVAQQLHNGGIAG